jgi:1-aminocyclopropane-1-carboxylate deaminase/D-cysteine desulfhydrase-like pyridoxal-dependent ACC family enzyme
LLSLEEKFGIRKVVPLQRIDLKYFNISDIKLFVKREDLLHPNISGNKWYKLKYNLLEAAELKIETLLTFGGAYSNHIHAVASVGEKLGLSTIGIIRGEEHLPLNPTLEFAKKNRMKIFYLPRKEYRLKSHPDFINQLKNKFGEFYVIPEGGTNDLAVKGCEEIIQNIEINFDNIVVPVGTGGTLAGIIKAIKNQKNKKAIGIAVLKNAGFLNETISKLIGENQQNKNNFDWEIILDYHFGGYAKFNKILIDFINQFKEKTQIQLDPVYTGKMMFGILELINKGYFKKGSTIVAIHTGGLQGIQGFNERFGKNLLNI